MENNRNKPFYLQGNKNTGKSLIMAGIFLTVLALAVPFFILVAPILIVYGVIVVRKGKSELNTFLDEAIELYEKNEGVKCLAKLEKVLELDKDNTKAIIISALVKYKEEEYTETIKLLGRISKDVVSNALDIQLKLADSYLKTKDYKNAEVIYKELLKLQPKSEFIKKALQQCSL
ncbi:MAG: tetratricopeptide repeat protein [Clostridiaceae bacterium]|nr:tetratricopeptide repeat protein [Clostridiaceae bacterium]